MAAITSSIGVAPPGEFYPVNSRLYPCGTYDSGVSFSGMWKRMGEYYWGLLQELPAFFREKQEAVVFWSTCVVAAAMWIWPPLNKWMEAHYLPKWIAPLAIVLLVVYGMLRVNYDHICAARTRIAEFEKLPSARYSTLCVVQKELNDILRVHFTPGATFYSDSAALWQRVESDLFPYLHDDEKATLRELYHNPRAWQMSSFDRGTYDPLTDTHSGGSGKPLPQLHEIRESVAALHGLKNAIDSWAIRDRPSTPPAPRSAPRRGAD